MRFRPRKSALENAIRCLPRLAQDFLDAGDHAAENAKDAEQVHAFRIQVKRFRYTLEYFRACYGAAMDGYIGNVRDVQQRLGELNDCASSRELYQRLAKIGNSKRDPLRAVLESRQEQLLTRFRGQWCVPFQNPVFRKKLLRYLAHPPQEPEAKPRRRRKKRQAFAPAEAPVQLEVREQTAGLST